MARHRNVRSMKYSDEYDGYDDVYGHSVEDDHCVSPSEAAFMYNREGSKGQQIGAFINIAEEDEQENKIISDKSAELDSCIAKLKCLLGPTVTKQEMVNALLENELDIDRASNVLLDMTSSQLKQQEKKDKDDKLLLKPAKRFNVPKLNTFKIKNNPSTNKMNNSMQSLKFGVQSSSGKSFSSLSDLSSNHLKNVKVCISIPNFKINRTPVKEAGKQVAISTNKKTDSKDLGEIDLTKALIRDTSQKSVTSLIKKLDYLDINCEKETEIRGDFNCTMDISYILNKTSSISKKVSCFGKILCRKYRKFVPIIMKDKQTCKFVFDVLSPDDMILTCLRT